MNKVKLESINFLWCPVTQQKLTPISDKTLERINISIKNQYLYYYDGRKVEEPLESGFVNENNSLVYPIKMGIILVVKSFAIIMDTEKININTNDDFYKSIVKNFYDDIGWTQEADNNFKDAKLFEDLREVSQNYISNCRLRINKHIKKSGQYLLDVASGPIQYDEYLTFSNNYDYRICVDISFQALRQARNKLGENGIYILGDVTELPIRENTMDAVISLHTIYHVHKDQQEQVFRELYRVLKSNSTAVIVYSWGWHSMLMNIALLPIRTIRALKRIKHIVSRNLIRRKVLNKSAGLYFYVHNYKWLQQRNFPFSVELKVWRSLHTNFLKLYIHKNLFGKQFLNFIWKLEEKYPKFVGRIGAYPMFIIKK